MYGWFTVYFFGVVSHILKVTSMYGWFTVYKQVAEHLRDMKLKDAAKRLEEGLEETITYMSFPSEHWSRIRTNNTIERLNREIRRRTRVVGTFPDGNAALMLVCARLRHVAGTQWGAKCYLNMKHLDSMEVIEDQDDYIDFVS